MSSSSAKPLVIIFHNFGPYHLARLRGAAMFGPVHGLELSSTPDVYEWASTSDEDNFERSVLFEDSNSLAQPFDLMKKKMQAFLEEVNPGAVAINGWWDNGARAALSVCREKSIPTILMSETQADDGKRSVLKENIKSGLLSLFDAALVGGKPHAKYLVQLGMDRDQIFRGYDAVDVEYFEKNSNAARNNAERLKEEHGLPRPFFLTSNRFIFKKNLPMLMDAWMDYRKAVEDPWDLVLLGDGEMRGDLERQAKFARLTDHVHFPGFRQIEELPEFFGLASAFVHASTHEQWGLVINEAMASRLPVLGSDRCGSTREMLRHEKNGLVFNPFDRYELLKCLIRVHEDDNLRTKISEAGYRTACKYGPEAFGKNIWRAVERAEQKNASRNSRGKGALILKTVNVADQLLKLRSPSVS